MMAHVEGHQLGILLLIALTQMTLAEDQLKFEVTSFNPRTVDVTCAYKGDKTGILFSAYKDGNLCINFDSNCTSFDNDCGFHCLESDNSNALSFRVNLDGTCSEHISIRCSVRSSEAIINLDSYLRLGAESDNPKIFINDDPLVADTRSVQVKCNVTNKCQQTELEITGIKHLTSVVSSHTPKENRFMTIAEAYGIFAEPGNYTLTCKEKGKEDVFGESLIVEVLEKPIHTHTDKEQTGQIWIAKVFVPVILVILIIVCVLLFIWRRRRNDDQQPMTNTSDNQQFNLENMEEGRSPRTLPGEKMPDIFKQNDSICGIWVDKDNEEGEKIFYYIKRKSEKEIHKAELDEERMLSLLESRSYKGYFALISSHSLENKVFMAYLTSVIVLSVKHESTFVLVLLENDVLSNNHLRNSLITDLKALDAHRFHVDASNGLGEDRLKSIDTKLKGHHFEAEDLANLPRPTGDLGIGLAWRYFLGYLKYILPGIKGRIEQYERTKKHTGKMYPNFVIVIPESGKIPTQLNNIHRRVSTYGPLDDGIKRPTSGHPERHFKNFVHQIKKKEGDCCYFCGEWSSSVLILSKLLDGEELRTCEMTKQLNLFTETLQSILQGDSSCKGNFVIFTFKDDSTSLLRLSDMIENPNEEQTKCNTTNSVIQVTRLAKGLAKAYHNQLSIFGPNLAEKIRSTKYYSSGKMLPKLFILLPHSCKCLDAVADEENITYIEKLHLLENPIAGNKRSYDAAIYKIQENYYACVEYCTTLKTMYEMAEKEDLSGLSPVQMAAELRVYYEILYDLLSASEFGHSIELVYYDDTKSRKLSDIILEKIKENLEEETSENLASDSQPLLRQNEWT